MKFSRSSKCSKTAVELTFTTQKANVPGLLVLFSTGITLLGKFGLKTQISSLS